MTIAPTPADAEGDPTWDARHGSIADELRLGVTGSSPADNARRADRAGQLLAANAARAHRAYQQAAGSLEEPYVVGVPVAQLVRRHHGDLVAAVADPGLVEVVRGLLGAVRYETEMVRDGEPTGDFEWVDPLTDPEEFHTLYDQVNQAREVAGLDPLEQEQVIDAARMAPDDRDILAQGLRAERVDQVVAGFRLGENPEVLTAFAKEHLESVPDAVAFMTGGVDNNDAVLYQAAREHVGIAGGFTRGELDAGNRALTDRFTQWRAAQSGARAGGPATRAAHQSPADGDVEAVTTLTVCDGRATLAPGPGHELGHQDQHSSGADRVSAPAARDSGGRAAPGAPGPPMRDPDLAGRLQRVRDRLAGLARDVVRRHDDFRHLPGPAGRRLR